jgi:hypothetical protein
LDVNIAGVVAIYKGYETVGGLNRFVVAGVFGETSDRLATHRYQRLSKSQGLLAQQ